ncbi:MAG: 16S rRNA (guanine(966)-N(2))-methyltransferase RsmD [Candidatus Omnitrophica bacterium]|nr:16S rRNA (guanine(966)-N(2))-methyltransferase RsmD [Candidatus Omnitrophota bacterium]
MRITGGDLRGRVIHVPKGVNIRPTLDKVRQAIFNILGDKVAGAAVLDLYSGSGSLGLEALSRGAGSVYFVEKNKECIEKIKGNLISLKLSEYATVRRADVLDMLVRLDKEGGKFDVIFLDPPYYKDLAKKTLINVSHCDILSPNNIVVAEHHKTDSIPEKIDSLEFMKEKRYGDTVVTFYEKTGRLPGQF